MFSPVFYVENQGIILAVTRMKQGDFPGGAVVRTLNAGSPGSIPGQGTRSSMHAATKSSRATTKDPASCN